MKAHSRPAAPTVEPRFGTHPGDVRRHVSALRDALELARTPPLADFVESVAFPDPTRSTDDDLLAVAMRLPASGYHPACTVRMGPDDDPLAPVDQHGRVRGVHGPGRGRRVDHGRRPPGPTRTSRRS